MTDPTNSDELWQELQDRAAVEAETIASAAGLDSSEDPRWGAELDFYAALEASAQPGAKPEPGDDHIIEAALAATESSTLIVAGDAAAPRPRVGLMVSLLAVAAAAALAWWAWPGDGSGLTADGSWTVAESSSSQAGDVLPMAVWLVADGNACVEDGTAKLCATAGTRMRIRESKGGKVEVELERGELEAITGQWQVIVAGDRRVLNAGENTTGPPAAIRSAPKPQVADVAPAVPVDPSAPVDPPLLEPTDTEATPVPVQRPTRRPEDATQSPATMLRSARELAGRGGSKQADAAYARLLKTHPKSPEAAAARVSLGQLRLRSGRARSALKLFEAYLRSGGALAEEANWGKIQALDRLGKTDALRRAVERFEARFPRSVYRAQARERLSE